MVTPDRIVAFEPTRHLFQNDRGRVGSAPVFGGEAVVEGGKDHVMPDLATVVQCHPAMILKMTASVDENVLAYRDILQNRIERGEYTKRRIDRLIKQAGYSSRISSGS